MSNSVKTAVGIIGAKFGTIDGMTGAGMSIPNCNNDKFDVGVSAVATGLNFFK